MIMLRAAALAAASIGDKGCRRRLVRLPIPPARRVDRPKAAAAEGAELKPVRVRRGGGGIERSLRVGGILVTTVCRKSSGFPVIS